MKMLSVALGKFAGMMVCVALVKSIASVALLRRAPLVAVKKMRGHVRMTLTVSEHVVAYSMSVVHLSVTRIILGSTRVLKQRSPLMVTELIVV